MKKILFLSMLLVLASCASTEQPRAEDSKMGNIGRAFEKIILPR